MKKQPLRVSLDVREPSVVELTVGDRVQLDRLTASKRGYLAERHGALVTPGVTRLALSPGNYFFKTLGDANLRVVTGGVEAGSTEDDKDGDWPDQVTNPLPSPNAKGDEPAGDPPRFTVEHT